MPRNPQVNLRDANGNVLGTLYVTVDGEIAIHQESSTEEVLLGSDGIDVSGVTTDRIQDGENPAETVSGTGATLSFAGTDERDIHDATDVTLSNASGASVTEDVTVDYYQGVDNTGTLLESETQSVTLADAASTTLTYLTGNFALDNVDYFVEVTATDLTVDGIDEHTLGATYTIEQTSTGDLVTVDQAGRERQRYDPMSDTVSFPAVDADSLQVSASAPGIRLNGSETNAADLTIRENAGAIELFDEGAGAVDTAWNLNPDLDIGNTTHAATDHEAGGSLELTLANLASMDATAVIIDTAANQPAAGTVDRVFIETDTGTVYRDNGTSWGVMATTNIADTDHTATDHEAGGGLEVTHNNLSITSSDHHARPVAGTLLSEDGSNNFNVDIATDTATASGDGAATTFTLAHSLGVIPTVAHVQATSVDANGTFFVSNKTSTDVDVTFNSAPASGTDNLTFDIITA